jgi:hypothetical protein
VETLSGDIAYECHRAAWRKRMIPLKCGFPDEEPATYTRFVLPFAYRLEQVKDNPAVFYEESTQIPGRTWRERYLTDETADVLFRRAKWFDLKQKEKEKEWAWQVEMAFRDREKIPVRMAPPQIILFEWPKGEGRRDCEDKGCDTLHTGFLLVDLHFPESKGTRPDLDDLLQLNEVFRYWQRPYEGHEKEDYRRLLSNVPIGPATEARRVGDKDCAVLDIYFGRWESFLALPIKTEDGSVWRLFPERWMKEARKWVEKPEAQKTDETGWIVYADNRAFVWTCAIVDGGASALQRFSSPSRQPLRASDYGHWVKLLNVDPPGPSPSATHAGVSRFEHKWAEERTYKRWQESRRDATFYGFCYHAGAMLGPPLRNPPMWCHFGQMYFDMAILLLYLRVSLFRFSKELNAISAEARDAGREAGQEKWKKRFQDLRWQFSLFTNLYQFPLLSNQQQAVEMYSIARKAMDVDELFREIRDEIASSHEFLAVKEAHEMTQTTMRLSVVATLGLAAALGVGFLGMNVIVKELAKKELVGASEWLLFAIMMVVSFVFVAVVVFFSKCLSQGIGGLAELWPLTYNKVTGWFGRKQ